MTGGAEGVLAAVALTAGAAVMTMGGFPASARPAKPVPLRDRAAATASGHRVPRALARLAPRKSLPVRRHLYDRAVVAGTSAGTAHYLLIGSSGGVYPFGARGSGSALGHPLRSPVVGGAPSGPGGYWLVGRDGGVYTFGRAGFFGSAARLLLRDPVVGMAATPSGRGYWLVGRDGGVFAYGDARYFGSAARLLLRDPVVGMAATPSGRGYWLVGRDGGVFAYGDARYYGSAAHLPLHDPVVGMAATPSGRGYWLVGRDGGVFAYGDARYYGSAVHLPLHAPVVGIAATPSGRGYWLFGQDGGVFTYGDAPYLGAAGHHVDAAGRATAAPAGSLPAHAPAPPAARLASSAYPASYPRGATGLDVSRWQCGDVPRRPRAVAVVQVTGGSLDRPANPCYGREARWAGGALSAYVFMDGLPEPAPQASRNGPAGRCPRPDVACESFNFGWAWSRHWVAYSWRLNIRPRMWWLDIESSGGWRGVGSNDLVIRGAVAGLRSTGVEVGIYSTAYQWQAIAGPLAFPGMPEWVPGAGRLSGAGATATGYCAAGDRHAFARGSLRLVQWGYHGRFAGAYEGPARYDADYSCG